MDKEQEDIIAIIGLGYVGLPLAIAFANHYEVVGLDINSSRVDELKQLKDVTGEADLDTLQEALNSNLTLTADRGDLKKCSVYIITVPTPITKFKTPDLTYLVEASKMHRRKEEFNGVLNG